MILSRSKNYYNFVYTGAQNIWFLFIVMKEKQEAFWQLLEVLLQIESIGQACL